MRAKLKGKISQVRSIGNGQVLMSVEFAGDCDAKSIDAKPIEMYCDITLKKLVADKINLGTIFALELTTDEE